MSVDFEAQPLGDCAVILRAPGHPEVNPAMWLQQRQRWLALGCDGLRDAAPTPTCLALHFDVDWVAQQALPLLQRVSQLMAELPQAMESSDSGPAREHHVPVCYEPSHAPDLMVLAQQLNMSSDELVRRHSEPTYQVAMLGFLPGFAYLEGLDPLLHVPRLARPREQVAAGSVGIGGHYSGIYPQPSPGGWLLIGRCPWPMFDAQHARPCRLMVGDSVRFVAISAERFASLLGNREQGAWD